MTQPNYDPDPLYVPEPDSDEAHYEAAAAYFERLDYEKPGVPRAVLLWGFMATLVMLGIIAAALLIAAPRSGQQPPSTAAALSGVPLPPPSPAEREATRGTESVLGSAADTPTVGAPRSDASVSQVAGKTGPPEPRAVLPDTATEVAGTATWCAPTPKYCHGWGGKAKVAAVESFVWGDRPYNVTVCHTGRCVVVRVVSHCDCGRTLIDLSPYAFTRLAPLGLGRIDVTVSNSGRILPVPATDTEGLRH